jgi:hypothetical protein
MIATGKRARRLSGLGRPQLKRMSHVHKSPEKIRRMGWTRKKKENK